MVFKKRRKLFCSLVAVFCLLGTIVILYSFGWRLDPETFQVKKSGGLVINLASSRAIIRVGEDVFRTNPDILHQGTLIANLFPRMYKIEAEEQGYQSWKKNLEVRPSMVTKTHPIILIPQKPLRESILENVKNFWLGPKFLAVKTIYNRFLINGQPARGIKVLEWSNNGNLALVFDNQKKNYYLIDILQENTALNLNLVLKNLTSDQLLRIGFYSSDDNKLIITTSTGLYVLNVGKLTLEQVDPELLDQVFANGKISPDKQKLAVWDENLKTIKIQFLKNEEILNKGSGEEIRLNTGFNEPPADFAWHKNSAYLFMQYSSNLYFVEIDDRSPLNLQFISDGVDKFQYNSRNNELYILVSGILYKLDLK